MEEWKARCGEDNVQHPFPIPCLTGGIFVFPELRTQRSKVERYTELTRKNLHTPFFLSRDL